MFLCHIANDTYSPWTAQGFFSKYSEMSSCATLSCSADALVPVPFMHHPDGSSVMLCERCARLIPQRLMTKSEFVKSSLGPVIDLRSMAYARRDLIRLLEDNIEIDPDNSLWNIVKILNEWMDFIRRS